MSDSIKKWHEMQEENNKVYKREIAKYIFVLDFSDGKVYKYNISNEDWNPDSESLEAYLSGAGHKLTNCEWMTTESGNIEYGNTN